MKTLVTLAAAAVAFTAIPCQAQSPADGTVLVPYGDLNLAASADRKTLYGRVGSAVRNVCNFDAVGIAADYRTCAGLAWKDARPQIDAALANGGQLALNGAAYITVSRRLR